MTLAIIAVGMVFLLSSKGRGEKKEKVKEVVLSKKETDIEQLENLSNYSKYIESDYLDEEGFVKSENRQEVLDLFYTEAIKACEDGIVNNVKRQEDSVLIEVNDYLDFLYSPKDRSFASNGSGDISIITYEVNYEENRVQDTYNVSYGIPDIQAKIQKSFSIDSEHLNYKDKDCGIEALNKMKTPGKKIIIFNTHGFTGNQDTKETYILSGINYFELEQAKLDNPTEENLKNFGLVEHNLGVNDHKDDVDIPFHLLLANYLYGADFDKNKIVVNQDYIVCLNAAFFKNLSTEDYLNDSIVILGACLTAASESNDKRNPLIDSVLECGANVVIGFDNLVMKDYANLFAINFLDELVTDDSGKNNTFIDAFEKAKIKTEELDTKYNIYCKETAIVKSLYEDDIKNGKMTFSDALERVINDDYEHNESLDHLTYNEPWSTPYTNDGYSDDTKQFSISCNAKIYGNTNITFEEWLNGVKETDNDHPISSDKYNEYDRLLSHTEYEYDDKGNRIKSIEQFFGDQVYNNEKYLITNLTYDKNNNILSSVREVHAEVDEKPKRLSEAIYYFYDDNGLLIEQQCYNGPSESDLYLYSYDENGMRTGVIYASGDWGSGDKDFLYEVHKIERFSEYGWFNYSIQKYNCEVEYDENGNLIKEVWIKEGEDKPYRTFTYEYDGNNNQIEKSSSNNQTYTYKYADNNRLIEEYLQRDKVTIKYNYSDSAQQDNSDNTDTPQMESTNNNSGSSEVNHFESLIISVRNMYSEKCPDVVEAYQVVDSDEVVLLFRLNDGKFIIASDINGVQIEDYNYNVRVIDYFSEYKLGIIHIYDIQRMPVVNGKKATVTAKLNIRSGPGLYYDRVKIDGEYAVAGIGEVVTIVEEDRDSDNDLWYKVKFKRNGKEYTNWISGMYVSIEQ